MSAHEISSTLQKNVFQFGLSSKVLAGQYICRLKRWAGTHFFGSRIFQDWKLGPKRLFSGRAAGSLSEFFSVLLLLDQNQCESEPSVRELVWQDTAPENWCGSGPIRQIVRIPDFKQASLQCWWANQSNQIKQKVPKTCRCEQPYMRMRKGSWL